MSIVIDELFETVVSGPLYTRSKPVCLQCLKKLTGQATIVNCERCKAPLCSTSCMNGKWHAMECKVEFILICERC